MKDKLSAITENGNVFSLLCALSAAPNHYGYRIRCGDKSAYCRRDRLFLGFAQEIYIFCNYSNRRWDLFLNIAKFEADSDYGNGDKALAFTASIEVRNDCNEYEYDDASDSDNNLQQQPGSEILHSSETSAYGEQSGGKHTGNSMKVTVYDSLGSSL